MLNFMNKGLVCAKYEDDEAILTNLFCNIKMASNLEEYVLAHTTLQYDK